MSRQRDRDTLIAQLSRELPDRSLYEVTDLARRLLRAGTTLQRLAEAECIGDWPCDNGKRAVHFCDRCQAGYVRSAMTKIRETPADSRPGGLRLLCQSCRLQDRVTLLCAEYGLTPIFSGDPRGAVFLVIPPSYAARNAGRDIHNLEGIYVS